MILSEELPRTRSRIPFSAVIMLFFSSLVVLISVFILVNYVTGIFQRQSGLEDQLQAVLTEESAAELLAADLSAGSIHDYSRIPTYRIGDQQTSFQLMGVNSTSPEELEWSIPYGEVLQVIPLETGITAAVLSIEGDILQIDELSFTGSRGIRRICEIEAPDLEVSSASAAAYGDLLFVLVPGRPGFGGKLAVFSSDSLVYSMPVREGFQEAGAFISAGQIEGETAAVISDGSVRGILVYPGTGEHISVASPFGTFPVLYQSDRLLGDASMPGTMYGDDVVLDLLTDDFTGDGTPDLVFAGHQKVVLMDGASGRLFEDSLAGYGLTAWGTAETRGLLSCRWVSIDAGERWRVFLNGGFTDSPGPEFLPFDWEGRLYHTRGSMMGTISDTVFIATESTGRLLPLFSGYDHSFCDLDGGGVDLVSFEGSTLKVLVDPLEGNGLHLSLLAITRDPESDLMIRSGWDFMVFGSGPGRRVRWERSG